MSNTIAEKILSRASGRKDVAPGDIVDANIDLAMSHDNTLLVYKITKEIGINKVWNPNKIAIVLDHRSPANCIKTAENHKKIREFVTWQNINNFFDVGEGVCHQVLPEQGLVLPGMLIVGSDSHTTTYGAFGAFATGIGATDMASVWSTGTLWLKIPETFGFNIYGKLESFVMSKDIILKIIGKIGSDGANYKSCEFFGEAVEKMSIDSRMCISNQAMEMGAKSAIFASDEATREYLKTKTSKKLENIKSDDNVKYEKTFDFDVENIEPQIACPNKVDNIKSVSEVIGTTIDQAVLGSCTNGRLEDLAIAADVLKGKKISKNIRMLIVPSSRLVYLQAIQKGFIEIFVKSGATIINPGCGPCLGLHEGVVGKEECVISSTNRNFKGRMGSPEAKIYLASPATVAFSAINGEISDPREIIK